MSSPSKTERTGRGGPGRASRAVSGGETHRLDIQGLRALAVLMVVAFHVDASLVPGGFTGVDVFFVISGYVITASLLRELDRTDAVGLRNFYERRARRILPSLALALTATSLLAVAFLSPLGPQRLTLETSIAAALLCANAYLWNAPTGYFDVDQSQNALLHTWSLSVEEQFYLAFPVVVAATWRLTRRAGHRARRWSLLLVLAGGAGASGLFALATTAGRGERVFDTPEQVAFYSAPSRAWEFLVGALAAFVLPRCSAIPRGWRQLATATGLVAIGWSTLHTDAGAGFPAPAALVPVAGGVLVVLGGVAGDGLARLLAVAPLTRIGDYSYGWYLWHWPLIVMVRTYSDATWLASLAALVALGVAALTHHTVEAPIRRDLRLRGRRALLLGAVCVATPVILGISLLPVTRSIVNRDLQQAYRYHTDFERGCDEKRPLGGRDLAPCTWDVAGARGTVVLVGDSNAGHYSEPFIAAAHRAGFRAVIATQSGCPFIDLAVHSDEDLDPECRPFVTGTVRALVADPPAAVFVSSSSAYVTADKFAFERSPGTWTRVPAEKAALWRTGLERTLGPLDEVGVPVVVVHAAPRQPRLDLLDCTPVTLLVDPQRCVAATSRLGAVTFRAPAHAAEQAVVDELHAADAIDPLPALCAGQGCPTRRGDTWLYRDDTHLSIDGSMTLVPLFAEALDRLRAGSGR